MRKGKTEFVTLFAVFLLYGRLAPGSRKKEPKRGKMFAALPPVLDLPLLNMSVNIPNKQDRNRDRGD